MPLPRKVRQKLTGSYLLYAGTIFLSAFLLFVVQPIAGKHLLPYFGGSSSVWATSLLFFTTMLFLGYLYVYVLTSYAGKRQGMIHTAVVAFVMVATIASLLTSHTLYPSFDWTIGSTGAPARNVLIALALAIGLPYFLLSTTGPLLQYWWARVSNKEPYKLYALSNIGSLLALVSYPFFIEPHISLPYAETLWALVFLLFTLASVSICVTYIRLPQRVESSPDAKAPVLKVSTRLFWIILAALPSFMLVATTTDITQVVAPVPLLWVIPLALYLITFILAFRGWGQSIFLPILVLVAAFAAYSYMTAIFADVLLRVSSYVLLLFFVGLLCHGRLYRGRPHTQHLPMFYLLISFGGMIGALAGSMLAPAVFSGFFEFPLGIALSAMCATWLLSEAFFPRILDRDKILLTRIVLICGIVVLFSNAISVDNGTPSILSRNFYGPAEVHFRANMTSLLHGGTLHGLQPTSKEWRFLPTSYYAPGSGVGRAMMFEKDIRKGKEIRVGILGLGTGSIASHCADGDTFVFYEIDPRMENIARTYFNYLAHCKGSEVRIGDGRLLLEAEARAGALGKYDILAMDAFSDDTVPAHLLTLQAVKLYARHLRSDQSIVAIHVSNRYLDLSPVILKIAAQLGMSAMVVRDSGDSNEFGTPSNWVLLSKDSKVFASVAFANSNSVLPDTRFAPIWTDDYTSLFTVFNPPFPWQ